MFFKKKEDKGRLPDLPPLPADSFAIRKPERTGILNDFSLDSEQEKQERHSLPSFPDSLMRKGFSQSAIKDAVGQNQRSELPELPDDAEIVKKEREAEKKEWAEDEGLYSPSEIIEIPRKAGNGVEKNQDIFVKLDKFKNGKKSLNEMRERIDEIDGLFKRIREVKMREEQELAGWEAEINFVKDRLKQVTENIFEKV